MIMTITTPAAIKVRLLPLAAAVVLVVATELVVAVLVVVGTELEVVTTELELEVVEDCEPVVLEPVADVALVTVVEVEPPVPCPKFRPQN